MTMSGIHELLGKPCSQINNERHDSRQRLVRQIGQMLARIWLQRRRESQIRSNTLDSTMGKSPAARE